MLIFSLDKQRLKRHFEKDVVLFSYHLGDLDDFYYPHCQFAVDYGDKSKIEDAILVYTGCEVPSVLAFGLTDIFDSLVREMLPLLPMKFYCHFQEKHRALFLENYKETKLGSFHKMKLENFTNIKTNSEISVQQLDMTHLEMLKQLYSKAYPQNYFTERMLETGKYYGCIVDGNIVSVSGVHVHSDEYKIAVLGNIATAQEFRGQGISIQVTSRLLEDLTSDGKTVCLNVKADNKAAIASYTKLGFVKVHEYEEAFFELK